MRPRTDRHTDRQTFVTTIHFASYTTPRKMYNDVEEIRTLLLLFCQLNIIAGGFIHWWEARGFVPTQRPSAPGSAIVNIDRPLERKPSLDVAPTTFRLVLYLFAVFNSSLLFVHVIWLFQFHFFRFQAKTNVSSCDLELWPLTLTYILGLGST